MTHTIEFKDFQEVVNYLDENFPSWQMDLIDRDWITAFCDDTRLDIYDGKTLEITLAE